LIHKKNFAKIVINLIFTEIFFMQINLTNKIVIVTGASKGIGEACAYMMGKAGAKIMLSSRNEASLSVVAERFAAENIDVSFFTCNTGNADELKALLDFTVSKFGGVDVLVNNAATNPIFGPIENTDIRAFDKIMDVNVKGPFLLANMAMPYLKARGGGSIINISSVEGFSPSEGLGIYSVSKAALLQLTKATALEWGKYNIRVNAVCPGLIQTKFSEALWSNDYILKQALKRIPTGRVGQSDEVASLVTYLASDYAAYCTGAAMTVDGGYLV
jgi:dehydrogenase/reductase SDR family member 4